MNRDNHRDEAKMVIDCFAGGGGASQGIEDALGRPCDVAVNHDPKAIAMHKANHPHTHHMTEDIWEADLESYAAGKQVGLMWASPDCFTAGHLVWTNEGYVPIENVRPMDYVLTHKGRLKMVTRFVKKSAYDLCEVSISGCEPQTVTPNHRYYARKKVRVDGRMALGEPEWVEAEALGKDFKVGIPINSKAVVPEWKGSVRYMSNQYGIVKAEYANTLNPHMGNRQFWWIVGRYFADGSLAMDKYTVDICCGLKAAQSEIRDRLLDVGLQFTERDKLTSHSFLLSSKELCEFLYQFGIGAAEKSITPLILDLPASLLEGFLEGYISGDGCYDTKPQNPICYINTVSRTLAYGLQQCILKTWGVYGCLHVSENSNVIQGRLVNTRPVYSLSFRINRTARSKFRIENGMAWVNVTGVARGKRSQYVSVFTLSVEEDESFTVGNVAVHNCTHFSKAKGGKPRESGIRMLPWAVHKHAMALSPDVIIMENVSEIQQWGPLDKSGRPVKSKEGAEYNRFVDHMRDLGYTFECRELIAADFGAPTSRKRWYAVMRRDGKRTVWPDRDHAARGSGSALVPYVPAASVIDWSLPCPSIFAGRDEIRSAYGLTAVRPLAAKTMRRIVRGLDRYVLSCNDPFIVSGACSYLPINNNEAVGTHPLDPLSTITTGGHKMVASAFLSEYFGTAADGLDVRDPLRTITTHDREAVTAAYLTAFYGGPHGGSIGQDLGDPLRTITTASGAHFGLVSANLSQTECAPCSPFITEFYGNGVASDVRAPLHTVTTSPGHFGLVRAVYSQRLGHWPEIRALLNEHCGYALSDDEVLVTTIGGVPHFVSDIGLRMLTPEELKLAQGFPPDYIIDHYWDGAPVPKTQQVRMIGNSVVPIMARKLVGANCL